MTSSFQGLRMRAAGVVAGAAASFWSAAAFAQDMVGQPTPGGIAMQPGVTPLREDAIWFHNVILMPIITVITLFVLALIVIVAVRFNKRANPVPAKWSHNTPIEIIWTVVPVMILTVIAVFSFKLLFAYNDLPKPDLTIKETGYQWYWGFEYPDQKVDEFISNILPEDQAAARKEPYKLATTDPLVVPVNKVVRVQVTGAAGCVIVGAGAGAAGLTIAAADWAADSATGVLWDSGTDIGAVAEPAAEPPFLAIQASKSAWLTTLTSMGMKAWSTPQSSRQLP